MYKRLVLSFKWGFFTSTEDTRDSVEGDTV
jgi:hypothetical protein